MKKLSIANITVRAPVKAGRLGQPRTEQLSTLPERIAQEIASRIQSGALPAGARIVEAEIAGHFGVSHSPVRDALRILNKRGLVELLPRRGARVAGIDRDAIQDHSQVLSTALVVAVRRSLAALGKKEAAELRQTIENDADVLEKLASSRKFESSVFYAKVNEAIEHILKSGEFSFLPDIVHRMFAKFSTLAVLLLDGERAGDIAAKWRLLANVGKTPAQDAKFGWDFDIFSFETRARRNSPHVQRYFKNPPAGSRALRVPEYPEVQTFIDSVDATLMPDGPKHPTLAEQISDKIRESIHAGVISYGDRLTEIDLSEHFLTSRGPVREALRILDEQGLIELRPRRGGIVNPLTVGEVDEIYDLRAALSMLSGGLAASRHLATPQWERMMNTGISLMERVARSKTADPIVWIELRRALGKLIYFISNNEVIGYVGLQLEHRLATHYRLAEPTGRKAITASWRSIKDAIAKGDAEIASKLMRERVEIAKPKAIEETRLRIEMNRIPASRQLAV